MHPAPYTKMTTLMTAISKYLICGIERLRRMRRPVRLAVIVCMLLLVGLLDFRTGDQLDLSVFYLPFVALTVWVAGLRASLWMALFASVLWLVDDFAVPEVPLPDFFKYWQTVMRFVVFASFAGVIAQLRAALDREKSQARRDFLTGLLNVRGVLEAAEIEVTRSHRHQRPLTIAFLDCDNFKQINDHLGHSVGNELLVEIGRTLLASIRGSDVAGRMGGDEFVLLFPELDGRAARQAIEKSLSQLAAVMLAHEWPVTFSVGLASFKVAPDSVEELVRAADNLMYEAKRSGKNTVRSLDIESEMPDGVAALACS